MLRKELDNAITLLQRHQRLYLSSIATLCSYTDVVAALDPGTKPVPAPLTHQPTAQAA